MSSTVIFISIFTFDIKKNKCLSLNSISNKFPCKFEKEILPNWILQIYKSILLYSVNPALIPSSSEEVSAKKRDEVKPQKREPKKPKKDSASKDKEYKRIKTYGGTSKLSGSGGTTYCVFPFRYNGEPLTSCIKTKDRKRSWCALSSNYDRDSLWGYCDEDHDDGSDVEIRDPSGKKRMMPKDTKGTSQLSQVKTVEGNKIKSLESKSFLNNLLS